MKNEQYICDRCGNPILISPGEKVRKPTPWKLREKHIVTTIWFQKYSKLDTCDFMHDLCNDCMAEFVRWWNNPEKGWWSADGEKADD
ncbi:MAG: hypothetical protein IKQ01_06440 [Bacteroidales bacterium]|nr:hypothetical protein [Bacteroidales bacterium]